MYGCPLTSVRREVSIIEVTLTSRRAWRERRSGRGDREEDGGMTEVKAMLTWGIVWMNYIEVKCSQCFELKI